MGCAGEGGADPSICCGSGPISPLEECVSVTEEVEEYLSFLTSGSQAHTDTGPFYYLHSHTRKRLSQSTSQLRSAKEAHRMNEQRKDRCLTNQTIYPKVGSLRWKYLHVLNISSKAGVHNVSKMTPYFTIFHSIITSSGL